MGFGDYLSHAGRSVAGTVTDPLSSVRSVGGDIKSGWDASGIGGAVAGLNPFADRVPKPNLSAYQVDPSAFQTTDRQNDLWKSLRNDQWGLDNRRAFTMDAAAQGQMRDRQLALADQLGAQARGEGPSLAAMQMREETDRGLAQAAQMAAGQRGMSAGMRARMMNQVAGQTRADAARAAALGRAQEQMNAQISLGNVLGQARGNDLTLAQANLQSQIDNRGQTDEARNAFYNQLIGMANTEQNAAMGLEAMKSDNHNATLGAQTSMYGAQQQAQGQRQAGMLGAFGTALGAYGALK